MCGISSDLDPSSVMAYMTSGRGSTAAVADLLNTRGVTIITPDSMGKSAWPCYGGELP